MKRFVQNTWASGIPILSGWMSVLYKVQRREREWVSSPVLKVLFGVWLLTLVVSWLCLGSGRGGEGTQCSELWVEG